ncbi:putative Holliday junction resolvase-like endonuclease [Peribacillus simplex]|nr:hypothetical protein SAMN05444672_1554 [Bacillus sp. OK838]
MNPIPLLILKPLNSIKNSPLPKLKKRLEGFILDKEKMTFLKDTEYDGKDSVFLDIDRIINEGMAGGNVYEVANLQNIEEAHDFYDETDPNINK